MRATWLVLGVVVAGAAVAYWELREDEPAAVAGAGEEGAPAPTPALQRDRTTPGAGDAPAATPVGPEARALEILAEMSKARAEGRTDRVQALFEALRREAWDAPAAIDYAVRAGWNLKEQAERLDGTERVRLLDKARRLLTRGLYAPPWFPAEGAPHPDRLRLLDAIRKMNSEVMRHGAGLPGVTRRYEVPAGIAPVQIVSREKLPYGHNALLMWNKGGNFDPTRLRAGETLLLPEEEVTIRVFLDRRVLAVFVGDWFAKEFVVGVGRPDAATPRGEFTVREKHENPDWWSPQGLVPYGDPRNELGAVWIPIVNDEYPSSYGIHGTKDPRSVGTACSNGCVRLVNDEAKELFWWVRTAASGGKATRVVIR
jgi:lipoprotein-anchoring transpeptidase ErfK/SrfK